MISYSLYDCFLGLVGLSDCGYYFRIVLYEESEILVLLQNELFFFALKIFFFEKII